MRLKLDENLGRRGAEALTAAGHDVTTVSGEGISGCADSALINICRAERRALVTLDLDFSNPLVFDPDLYSGIAVLRLPRRASPTDLHGTVETLIAALEQKDIQGKLWIVELGRIREYQPDEVENTDDPT